MIFLISFPYQNDYTKYIGSSEQNLVTFCFLPLIYLWGTSGQWHSSFSVATMATSCGKVLRL